MSSDPVLLDAFRRQCRTFGPQLALLMWSEQRGVDIDDLIDIAKEEDLRAVEGDSRDAAPRGVAAMTGLPRILDRFRTGYRCQDCDQWFRESHTCGSRGQHTHVYLKPKP